jgi:hypothetical protein
MTMTHDERNSLSLQGNTILNSPIAVGHGARSGNIGKAETAAWQTALAELRRQLTESREAGDLDPTTAAENLDRTDALEEELAQDPPRRTMVLDLLANLTRGVEGLACLGDAVARVNSAIQAVLPG